VRYSLTLPPENSANNELRTGMFAALIHISLGTLLATETIETGFQLCQEKIPTCDGKITPAYEGDMPSKCR
jgi:hypothetical protein